MNKGLRIFIFGVLIIMLSHSFVIADANKGPIAPSSSPGVPDAFMKLLNDINVENADSLYTAQQRLMVPVTGAFQKGHNDWQSAILKKLTESLNKTIALGKIRESSAHGKRIAEERLLNPLRSGRDERRIFPTRFLDKEMMPPGASPQYIIREASLDQLQFSYLISYILKSLYTSLSSQTRPPTSQEEAYAQAAFPFLIHSIVESYWLDVEAWHWSGSYRNMRERAAARLDWKKHPELQKKIYYKAFHDADLFFFGIAADLMNVRYLSEKTSIPIKLNEKEEKLLEEIRSMALRVIKQRLEANDGFDWQVGVWTDHPDFLYAGYTGDKMPETECRKTDVSEDTSHFHRWPWWLRSYRDSWPNKSEQYNYYKSLLTRLARQFVVKVAAEKEEGVLLNNYMDGSNGWYRVKYQNRNWGYGPYGLSRTALMGSWYSLAPNGDHIKRINRLFCSMVDKHKDINSFWIKYYGWYDGNNDLRNAWGSRDVSSDLKNYYDLVCQVTRELGWIEGD